MPERRDIVDVVADELLGRPFPTPQAGEEERRAAQEELAVKAGVARGEIRQVDPKALSTILDQEHQRISPQVRARAEQIRKDTMVPAPALEDPSARADVYDRLRNTRRAVSAGLYAIIPSADAGQTPVEKSMLAHARMDQLKAMNDRAIRPGMAEVPFDLRFGGPADWKTKGPIGAPEVIRRKRAIEYVPIATELADLTKNLQLYQATQRLTADEYKDYALYSEDTRRYAETHPKANLRAEEQRARDLKIIENFLLIQQEAAERGMTTWGEVADGVARMIPYMLEFLMTAGIVSSMSAPARAAGKKLLRHAMSTTTRWAIKAGTRVGAGLIHAGVRTALLPTAPAQAIQRMIPRGMQITPHGEFIFAEAGDKPATAFMRAYADVFAEMFSEETGPAFGRGGRAVLARIPGARKAFASVGRRLWKRIPAAVKAAFKRAGYTGLLEEWGEERMKDTTIAVLNIPPPQMGETNEEVFVRMNKAIFPGWHQTLVEFGVLSFPLGARALTAIPGAVLGPGAAPEAPPSPPAAPVAPPEVPEAPKPPPKVPEPADRVAEIQRMNFAQASDLLAERGLLEDLTAKKGAELTLKAMQDAIIADEGLTEAAKPPVPPAEEAAEKRRAGLMKKKKAELVALARERGVPASDTWTKTELVLRIMSAKPAAPAEAKQPWEMTQNEFGTLVDKLGPEIDAVTKDRAPQDWPQPAKDFFQAHKPMSREDVAEFSRLLGYTPAETQAFMRYRDLMEGAKDATDIYTAHRAAVEAALAEGKPVPPEVLADYPDLAKLKAEKGKEDEEAEKEGPVKPPEAPPPAPPGAVSVHGIYEGAWVDTPKGRGVVKEVNVETSGLVVDLEWGTTTRGRRWKGPAEEATLVDWDAEDAARRAKMVPVETGDPALQVWAEKGKQARVRALLKKLGGLKRKLPPHKPPYAPSLKFIGLPGIAKTVAARVKALAAGSLQRGESHYALAGVLRDGKYLVVTDGHLLFRLEIDVEQPDGAYAFTKQGAIGEAIEGNFPKYKDVIPNKTGKGPRTTVTVDVEPTLKALRSALYFLGPDAEYKGVMAVLNTDGTLGFATTRAGIGQAELNVESGFRELSGWGEPFLRALEWHWREGDKKVQMQFTAYNKPIRFDGNTGNTLSVIMPVGVEPGTAERVRKEIEGVEAEVAEGPAEPSLARYALPRPERVTPGVPEMPTSRAGMIARIKAILTRKKLTPRRIILKMAQSFGQALRTGRLRMRKAVGEYYSAELLTRLRNATSIPTAAHELGHHLHNVVWKKAKTPIRGRISAKAFPRELWPEIAKLAYPGAKAKVVEGFAEFIRIYLIAPAKAKDRAPAFYAWFEREIQLNHPEIFDMLGQTQNDIAEFLKKSAKGRILAQLSIGERKPRTQTLQRLVAGLYDDNYAFKAAVKELYGDEVAITRDFGRLAQMVKGSAPGRAVAAIYDGLRSYRDPRKVIGTALADIFKPVADKLDDLRSYMTSQRAIVLRERGIMTGIDTADARAEVERLSSDEAIAKAANDLYEFQDKFLDYLVEAELMDRASASQIKATSLFYIPFYRVLEEAVRTPTGSTRRFVDLPGAIKRIKGSGRPIIDPLESIVKNIFAFIHLGEQQRVARALVAAAKEKGAGWLATKVKKRAYPIQITGQDMRAIAVKFGMSKAEAQRFPDEAIANIFRTSSFPSPRENVAVILAKGKPELWQIDPEVYTALRRLNAESIPTFLRVMSYPAGWLRAGATMTPEFVRRNIVRDVWQASIYTAHGIIHPFDMARGLSTAIGKPKAYYDWVASGGGYGALVSIDRSLMQEALDNVVSHPTLASEIRRYTLRPWLLAPLTLRAARKVSETVEEATRIAEYLKAPRSTIEENYAAAYGSRELTLDFNKMGSWIRPLNRVIPFLGVSIQGPVKVAQMHLKHPVRTSIKGLTFITLPSLICYFFNRGRKDWEELPAWRRALFLNIPLPGGGFLPIPYPFELGMIYGSGPVSLLEYIDKKDPAAVTEWFKQLLKALTPPAIPTILLVPLQWATNWSFFRERPIVPKRETRLPPEQQAGPYTSVTSKKIGETITVSPRQIDEAVGGIFGGMGRHALVLSDAAIRRISKEQGVPNGMRWWERTPIFRDLYVESYRSNSRSVEQFYAELANTETNVSRLGDQVSSELLRKQTNLRWTSRMMAQIRKDVRHIQAAKEIPAEQKRILLRVKAMQLVNQARGALGKELLPPPAEE